MKKEAKQKKQVAYALFALGLILLVVGVSYAAYTFSGTGTKENVITTGQIRVSFEEKNNIKIQNRYAETDAVGLASTDPNSQMTFTVSSDITGEAVVNYAIGLTSITEGSTLKQDYIKIYLTKNESVANGFTSGTGKTIGSFASSKVEGYLDSHAITQGTVSGKQTDTYVLKAWIDENYDLPISDTTQNKVHSNSTTSETFSFKIKVVGTDSTLQIESGSGSNIQKDSSNANAPELASNMIPVIYDTGNNTWVKADGTNKDLTWFNYTDKKWANAVTVTSTNRDTYLKATPGTPIPMNDINTMWVWIPRFSATMNGSYNGGTKSAPGAFSIIFVDKETSAHDSFTFGSDPISGFWMGKFEITGSVSSACTNTNCNVSSVTILPNSASLKNQSVSSFFYMSRSMETSGNAYGFDKTKDTTLDTHMLKNNEWGAVAYLTQSIYGRCTSSTSCTEVTENNSGPIGAGGGSASLEPEIDYNIRLLAASNCSTTSTGACDYVTNINQSTTGNIYGVYDMSGGAEEYVMGNYNNTIDSSQFTTATLPNTKYYNVYTTESAYTNAGLQHALTETKNWYGDYAYFVKSGNPWFIRGGSYNNAGNSGVFAFYYSRGSITSFGSRSTITIN